VRFARRCEESRGVRDGKAAFRRNKGGREDVWVDLKLRD
jgi:hypothetical protein